ncbi:hypothetical protein ZIOFF_074769 [Zingiber officinale]|uniref:Hydrophobic seed protein domain-containing protein n=1 Tax=Zingiber officinale TaxID=94328 RepID=A0A8J5BY15_ZINOF|nr:hypothetical protein ZIOFF_074769 [Zingiber officinale]
MGGSTLSTMPPPVINSPPASCTADSLKAWAMVELFGGRVNIEVGYPVANQCCKMLQGLVEVQEATVCLCTTVQLKLLNVVNVHLALQLPLIT